MKKVIGLLLIVLAMTVTANAQTYIPQTLEGMYYRIQGNNVQMFTADNLGLVNGLTNQLRRSGYRSVAEDWVFNGATYGMNTPSGYYPMYDRDHRPLSGRQRSERAAGIIGIPAAIGAAAGGWKGGIIGAAIGGSIALLNDSRYRGNSNNDRNVVVMPPYEQQQGQQSVYVGRDGIPVAVGYRPNRQGPVSKPPSTAGDWRVSNRTSKRAELWDGEQFIVRIEPWQSVRVDASESGYTAVLLIPNRSGGLDQETADIRSSSNFNGWDIVAPAVQ